MKYYSQILIAFAVILFIGLASCSKQSNVVTPKDNTAEITLPSVASSMEIAQPAQIKTGDESQPMILQPPSVDNRGMLLDPRGSKFARIFQQLKLTKDQQTQLQGFLKDYKDCIQPLIMELRKSEMEIIRKANQGRADLVKSYTQKIRDIKQNETDPKVARQKIADLQKEMKAALDDLSKRLKDALDNNPAKTRILAALKDCEDKLFREIESILTPAQLEIWKKWLADYLKLRG